MEKVIRTKPQIEFFYSFWSLEHTQDRPGVRRDASRKRPPPSLGGRHRCTRVSPGKQICLPASPSTGFKPFPWVSHCCLRSPLPLVPCCSWKGGVPRLPWLNTVFDEGERHLFPQFRPPGNKGDYAAGQSPGPSDRTGSGEAMALLSLDGESNLELCGGRFPANNEQMPQQACRAYVT